MERTFTVIASGPRQGWIIGGGRSVRYDLKDEPLTSASIDSDKFGGESPILFVYDFAGNVTKSKEPELFYMDIKIDQLEHEEFYHDYLHDLADAKGYTREKAAYAEKRDDSKKAKDDMKAARAAVQGQP